MKQLALFCILISFSGVANSQTRENVDSAIERMLEEQNFTFRAERMLPQGGRQRILTETVYMLKLADKKLMVDLPYVGRAFVATPGNTNGGIRFTSLEYTYRIVNRRKEGWNVTISPKDVSDVRECQLTVFGNGAASLTVSSNNRTVISYQGRILLPHEQE